MADRGSAAPLWKQAGRAWGARGVDWAYLAEDLGRASYEAVLREAKVGEGTRLLDIACGAGLATWMAAERGAVVAGLDASDGLLGIARERVPSGDFRAGDMTSLPWPDASFDVVTSFNGIWAGNDDALREGHRVLRPNGTVAIAFFGPIDKIDHVSVLAAVSGLMPVNDVVAGGSLLETSNPGVAEAMLEAAGFSAGVRGSVIGTNEWPDEEIAWRAIASMGPAWAAIELSGEAAVRAAVMPVIERFRAEDAGYRLRAQFDYLVAQRA